MADRRRNLKPSWWLGSCGHHDVRPRRIAAHQVVPLNRRAGGAAADDAATLEHLVELGERPGVGIRVDDVPLPAAVEPHGVRILQVLDEGFGVGDFRIVACAAS